MSSLHALRTLAELTASQWGMVTAAQAASHGVSRLTLSRLADAGHLERLTHGVYRVTAAPSDEFEALQAAWLSTRPGEVAEVRLRRRVDDVIVTGASAAQLHRIGDLPADRHEFSTSRRRQTQRPEIHYRTRTLPRQDITIAHGLPVTTMERTVADLVEVRTDLSLVSGVVADALRKGGLDAGRLQELLEPLAARNGFRVDDGKALLDHLVNLSGSLRGLSRTIRRLAGEADPSLASIAAITEDLRTLDAVARSRRSA